MAITVIKSFKAASIIYPLLKFFFPSSTNATNGRAVSRNRADPVFNSTKYKFLCVFLEGHIRIVSQLNNQVVDFEFGFVRQQSAFAVKVFINCRVFPMEFVENFYRI